MEPDHSALAVKARQRTDRSVCATGDDFSAVGEFVRPRRTHMTMNRLFLRGIVVSFFLCLTGSLAFGASSRTFVASNGTNNATCDRANPCDTFQHALTATSAGGEIDVLDPGDFGPVVISQSVSIVADGVLGGIQVSG